MELNIKTINLTKFPAIKQETDEWCIPACIENVVKYYDGDITQKEIVDYFKENGHTVRNIDFPKVAEIFNNKKDFKFHFEFKGKEIFNDKNEVMKYFCEKINKRQPILASIHTEYRGYQAVHIVVVVGHYDGGVIIFDPNRREKYTRCKEPDFKHCITNNLHTLKITPQPIDSR